MAAMARRGLYDDLLPRQDQGREEPRDADWEPLFSSSPGNNIDDDVDDDDVDVDDGGRSSIAKTKDPKSDGGEEDNGRAPSNSTTPKCVRRQRKCSHQNCRNLIVQGGRCIRTTWTTTTTRSTSIVAGIQLFLWRRYNARGAVARPGRSR